MRLASLSVQHTEANRDVVATVIRIHLIETDAMLELVGETLCHSIYQTNSNGGDGLATLNSTTLRKPVPCSLGQLGSAADENTNPRSKPRVDPINHGGGASRVRVSVGVVREPRRCVAEHLRHQLNRHTVGNRERGCGVSEVVEPDPANARLVAHGHPPLVER